MMNVEDDLNKGGNSSGENDKDGDDDLIILSNGFLTFSRTRARAQSSIREEEKFDMLDLSQIEGYKKIKSWFMYLNHKVQLSTTPYLAIG